jgi:2-polyprenyl-3-methyl-5-hydroxy-6-metoxy-1,4-benzoquinol methylase
MAVTHKQKMQEFLDAHHVNMPAEDFVRVTSNIYHAHEAANYDSSHISIDRTRNLWSDVLASLNTTFKKEQQLSVLDFGCGTGFAAEQLITSPLGTKIENVSCYDLSPDMIAQCKAKFSDDARFTYYADASGLNNMLQVEKLFDIVVCNSLLHHILEPDALFELIDGLLKPGGYFIMGHEPNKAFYHNTVLQHISYIFRFFKKVRMKLVPTAKPATSKNIAVLTHRDLVTQGIVPKSFPAQIIPKFVDIHVPMSNYKEQPWGEMGFDLKYINQYLGGRYSIIRQKSYNHIKDQGVYASATWSSIAEKLAKIYPSDGADSIFVFKKDR